MTDGSHELRQLAHLLRAGAEAADEIAQLRPCNADELYQLVDQARTMADRLDAIATSKIDDETGLI